MSSDTGIPVFRPILARCRSKTACQAFCQDFFWQVMMGKVPAYQGFFEKKCLAKIFGQKTFYNTYVSILYLFTRPPVSI